MELYLMRHGEALPGASDAERPLSPRGRDEVARVARMLAGVDGEGLEVRHSGLRRARETAAIVAGVLGLDSAPEELAELAPEEDTGPARRLAESAGAPLLLVGHLPHLATLAALLLDGSSSRAPIAFATATVACLARGTGRWQIRWVVTPELAALAPDPPAPR